MLQAVTVYCSSSTSLDERFHDVARVVGETIAQRGLDLVYGGGSIGLMGEISSAARGRWAGDRRDHPIAGRQGAS